MGRNIGQQQHSSDKKPLQERFWNRVHKMLHALNRRRRWHNVRKVLPNKRQGSGKHIIDGGSTEPSAGPSASTGQPPEGRDRHRKNKSDEQSGDESGSGSSKASKKFRIRSLISEEMLKRRGKHQQRRSPSPTKKHSKSSSKNHIESRSDHHMESDRPSTQSNGGGGSPSTIKKRKCDICAAMLTVSYLRQKALAMEQQKKAAAEENNDKTQKGVPRMQPSKSFSFNLMKSTRRKDFEIEELKRKLRECKDIETAKEKFILPMNQFKETGGPKPMLTRPESFKSPSTTAQKENNPTNHQSKSLKQKIGYVIKDSRKEKKRILMDAVFHKIPYGRRSSKDGKKLSPNKLKSSSTGSTKIDADKAAGLKKTSSSSEAMNKYRWLLNHTPATRDEKCHHGDYKPKLCVAEACLTVTTDRKTLKRVRSLPTISIFDFMQNPDFPVNTLHLRLASAVPDDQKPVENFLLPEKRNAAVAKGPKAVEKEAVEKPVEKEAVDENLEVGLNISERKENLNHEKDQPSGPTESVAKEAVIVNKDETVDENAETGSSKTPVHQEEMDHENEPKVDIKSPSKETKSVDKLDEAANESIDVVGGLDTFDHQEKDHQQDECSTAIGTPTKETELVEKVDENLGADLNILNHQEEVEPPEKESGGDIVGSTATESPAVVDVDKSFNEILGMFKVASDQKIKQEHENESSAAVESAAKDTKVDDKDEGVEKSIEDAENILDHQEEEKPTITASDDQDSSIQVTSLQGYVTDHSSAFVSLPNSPPLSLFEDFSDNEQYLFCTNDQPSTLQPSIEKSPIDEQDLFSIDDKRPKDVQPENLSTIKVKKPVERFLHLDLESVKDNLEFLYVKEVLERAGFLENQRLGEWYSTYQPIDPSLFAEVETRFLQNKNLAELETLKDDEAAQKMINDHHLLLFELINDALLDIYNKTFNHCPHPLTYCSKFRPMPVGCRVLEEVWDFVNTYLSFEADLYPTLDDVVSRDLEKGDGWMNLQPDAELVGIELEEMITDDLLDELVFDDLLM